MSGRIVHIPNFVSSSDATETFRPRPRATGPPYFLFVGRLERLKGLHTIIRTFECFAAAELWIAGTDSDEAHLRALADGNRRIRFLGHRSGRDLEALYRNAVAVMYPSANYQVGIPPAKVSSGQGAPLVIIEAFSQRTPVLASRSGRIPALLEQTGGGLVYSTEVELRHALDRVLADRAYRDALGQRGYDAYRQTWTADAHLGRYVALVDELSSGRRRPAGAAGVTS
jgi:glycosyltransferase involved in cell wall biosynthesis